MILPISWPLGSLISYPLMMFPLSYFSYSLPQSANLTLPMMTIFASFPFQATCSVTTTSSLSAHSLKSSDSPNSSDLIIRSFYRLNFNQLSHPSCSPLTCQVEVLGPSLTTPWHAGLPPLLLSCPIVPSWKNLWLNTPHMVYTCTCVVAKRGWRKSRPRLTPFKFMTPTSRGFLVPPGIPTIFC